ncbi:MAG: hypothetical protein KAV87_68420, partial [Desulfobacteraceae bacterium]|nr:hypothetical protein [Desulfobacteraceae bacterium]
MINCTGKPVYSVFAFLMLLAISGSVCAMQTDTVQFNATLGFGEYGFDSGYMGLDEVIARMQVRTYGTLGLNLADVTMNGNAWTDNGLIGV